MKYILLILISVYVSSCATLSKEDCQSIDWHERGKSDSLRGKTSKDFDAYAKTCTAHGAIIDQEKYASGREEGLKLFCTYDSGQQFGREGGVYYETCPQSLETEFLGGYRLGKREYELDQKEKELSRRKQDQVEEAKLRSRRALLYSHNAKECRFDSECTMNGDCRFGKCKEGGAKCTFNSDCKVEGRCSPERVCALGDCDTIRMCKYN
jgi:Protein of unknown function (DUF2799)